MRRNYNEFPDDLKSASKENTSAWEKNYVELHKLFAKEYHSHIQAEEKVK